MYKPSGAEGAEGGSGKCQLLTRVSESLSLKVAEAEFPYSPESLQTPFLV